MSNSALTLLASLLASCLVGPHADPGLAHGPLHKALPSLVALENQREWGQQSAQSAQSAQSTQSTQSTESTARTVSPVAHIHSSPEAQPGAQPSIADADDDADTDASQPISHERALRVQVQAHRGGNLRVTQAAQRCRLARGRWCMAFYLQAPVPVTPAPRGSKECVGGCGREGVCNYDLGLCDCPAGWTGPNCEQLQLRPCGKEKRRTGTAPANHTDAEGRDRDWTAPGWLAGRCPGLCDLMTGACYCGDDSKYGARPAPPGSPPGTRITPGRWLPNHCFPKQTKDGREVPWGNTPYEDIYGPQGWCNSDNPLKLCGCGMDGMGGMSCMQPYEATCPNQCSGHGTCRVGFCACDPGWYGHDCARKKAGSLPPEPGRIERGAGWVTPVASTPVEVAAATAGATATTAGTTAATAIHATAATATAAAGGGGRVDVADGGIGVGADAAAPRLRKRPLIYVYDLPAEFNTRLLQYRFSGGQCTWRKYDEHNNTVFNAANLYGLDSYLHETLLQSPHRTFNPEEADFFYVPAYATCLIWPVYGHHDFPWYSEAGGGGPVMGRVLHASYMLQAAKRWIEAHHPWWGRRGGRDHIWTALHDEGACWFPQEIYNTSIILTHWGRMDPHHTSHTAFTPWDNYTNNPIHPEYQPVDWRINTSFSHPCFTPGKDLVVPSWKLPQHYISSPLLGAVPQERDVLLYFQGDVGLHRMAHYSRGIRQKLYKLSTEQGWRAKYKIYIGTSADMPPGTYSHWLSRSKFALVAPGDGWSARMEDAILHGAIPVIIMDGVQAVFESILDIDQFSLRVREGALHNLPAILTSIPVDKVARMARRIARVWSRFAWAAHKLQRAEVNRLHLENLAQTDPEQRMPLATRTLLSVASNVRRRTLLATNSSQPLEQRQSGMHPLTTSHPKHTGMDHESGAYGPDDVPEVDWADGGMRGSGGIGGKSEGPCMFMDAGGGVREEKEREAGARAPRNQASHQAGAGGAASGSEFSEHGSAVATRQVLQHGVGPATGAGALGAGVEELKVQGGRQGRRRSGLGAGRPVRVGAPWPYEDDAFHTLMAWLYSRIPDTR